MKYIVVLFLCLGLCLAGGLDELPDEVKEMIISFHNECSAEGHVPDEALKEAMHTGVIPNDDGTKKHLFCMSKKIGFQKADGSMDLELIRKHASMFLDTPEKMDHLMTKCLLPQSTPEDTAHEAMQCFMNLKKM